MGSTVADEFRQAVWNGELEKVKACITLGVDINEYYDDGEPIFFEACKNRFILELFLAHPNLDINLKNSAGYNALMYSCMFSSSQGVEAVRRLCQVPGIDLNCQSRTGYTAAFVAVSDGEADCVKILREDIKKKNCRFGENCIIYLTPPPLLKE